VPPVLDADVAKVVLAAVPEEANLKRLGEAVGFVHERMDFWKNNLEEDVYAEGVLKDRYKIPVDWKKKSAVYQEEDNKSASENYSFVREEVKRLVESGQVVRWPKRPRCKNPLTVALKRKEDGTFKKRLVLDLSRCVNLAIEDNSYKMTTLRNALYSTREGDFQFLFDLKSVYHHLRLNPVCYELMGFKVMNEDGTYKFYVYVVLVFGLKVAAQVLGRLLKPVMSYLRQNGVPVDLYIDDGRTTSPSKKEAVCRFLFALDVQEKAGWIVSVDKCTRPEDTSQSLLFLRVMIDSVSMCVFVPPAKLAYIKVVLRKILFSKGAIPIKALASVVGKFIALECAFGPPILVGTRMASIQIDVAAKQYSWKVFLRLSEVTKAALQRVLQSVDLWNEAPIGFKVCDVTS
jgi:hypothetical protein